MFGLCRDFLFVPFFQICAVTPDKPDTYRMTVAADSNSKYFTVCSVLYHVILCILSFLTLTYFYLYPALTYLSALFLVLLWFLFPLLGINKASSILSYLISYTAARLATQDKLKWSWNKQDDLSAFFFSHFYQNKDEWSHLICVKTNPKHRPCQAGCYV